MTTPREDAIAARKQRERDLMAGNHNLGRHRGGRLVQGCPLCEPALGAEAETPDSLATYVPSRDEAGFLVATALGSGHWVDLASPETAEALARADFEEHELHRHGDKWADLPEDRYKQWWRDHAQSVLAAMRETGR